MARELGLNAAKLDNHRQELWKAPLPQFIEDLYTKRFGRERPRRRQAHRGDSSRRRVSPRRANHTSFNASRVTYGTGVTLRAPGRLRVVVNEPTWLVLMRDASNAVRVAGESSLVACLLLDADTGLVRGMSVQRSGAEACAQAMRTALTQPAGGLPPRRPARVLCGVGHREAVAAQLAIVLGGGLLPEVTEIVSEEAEDIFDSFIGHVAGRTQPDEFATAGDWQCWSSTPTPTGGGPVAALDRPEPLRPGGPRRGHTRPGTSRS